MKKRRREKEVLLVLKKKQSKAKQGSKETCSYCLKKSKASQVDKAKQRRLFKNPFIFDKEEVRSTQAQQGFFVSTYSKLKKRRAASGRVERKAALI